MTEHMRIVQQEELGGPEVLRLIEAPRPEPELTQIQVRVHAAGVNPTDWKQRASGYWYSLPIAQGWDVSGVVTAAAPGVTRFAVGDEVYGMPNFPHRPGAYADYVTAPARHFARKPTTLDHVGAAAVPLAALTAWQSLVDTAGIKEGRRVLVHAAGGGVGHFAVQIARALGAHVIGTASAGKHELVRDLGAHDVVDHTAVDFAEAVSGVDVVLDTIGGDYLERSMRVLAPGGLYIGLSNPFDVEGVAAAATEEGRGVRGTTVVVEPDHTALESITALVEDGRLRPVVSDTFPLEEAARAHERGETGRTTGKIVLTLT
ncbi:NADP-dependent oxidoreductase [Nocardiopsis sp. NRRL B-16309]|uniref:NADP-dependent oxidoreductase n=1 Tax=Nocardiopsis sp. NRRL B-16309 TaxID=1519494 RepID=UPI0006ADD330|nr:NADP-dependent oxidoreductase [Nocardiopsis sp. NRRL B-16309]KOX12454.1 NADPH:quinone reductase [Nocardiopsis sp. NRRL B-16309]